MAYCKSNIAQNTRTQALKCWPKPNLPCGHCCHLPVMEGDAKHSRSPNENVFSRNQLDVFERWFRAGDSNGDGRLDVEDFKRVWASLHMDITHMSAKWLIALVDDNKDGKLNFGEFVYLWVMALESPEFQSTPEGASMIRTMQLYGIIPGMENACCKKAACYTLNPWLQQERPFDQGDDRCPLEPSAPHSHLAEAKHLCEEAAKQRAAFIAKAKSVYEGHTAAKYQIQAERRAEFIKWARSTFEDTQAVNQRHAVAADANQQLTYHDPAVCTVMSRSSPAISEFSLDQCSFLADWFHRWDNNRDGLLDHGEIANMFRSLRIPVTPGALHAIMNYFDEDMDGKLNFREFLLLWRAAIYDPDFRRTAEGCKMAKQMRIHNLTPNTSRAAW
ncbi:uncharacterized protein LOC135401451 isoform X1 [Ornithodoros turicata]|uniref:uncharacterized protein LOC135401451 isoform X1 n=1 Tax=Ornithodoros turicata TaxID=34597 RepID=UPI0031389BA6